MLYKKDRYNQKEGYTLACILLFGKDEVILDTLPHHRTDLLLKIHDKERYDDRDTVKTNLIESYYRIMDFVNKHLPSPFYLEGDTRIDLRSILFREIAVNMLIHREFTHPYYARFIIEADKITIENANKPYIHGNINPDENIPYPKNPVLANFFKEIGLADELGSGVRKITKYAKEYAGHDPVLNDGDVFKLEWEINLFEQLRGKGKQTFSGVANQAGDTVRDTVLDFCREARKAAEIMEHLGYKNKTKFLNNIIYPLIKSGMLKQEYPDTPKHPKQKYITVKKES